MIQVYFTETNTATQYDFVAVVPYGTPRVILKKKGTTGEELHIIEGKGGQVLFNRFVNSIFVRGRGTTVTTAEMLTTYGVQYKRTVVKQSKPNLAEQRHILSTRNGIWENLHVTSSHFNIEEPTPNAEEGSASFRLYMELFGKSFNGTIKYHPKGLQKQAILVNPTDYLYSIITDRSTVQGGYEEFLANCGYDDTAYVRKIYKTIIATSEAKEKILGEFFPSFEIAFQDY